LLSIIKKLYAEPIIKAQIENEIDEIVFDLYGITSQERQIITKT